LRRLYLDTMEKVAQLAEGGGWLEGEIRRRQALMADRVRQDRVTPHSVSDIDSALAFNLEFARRRPSIVRQQVQAALQR